MNTIKKLFLLPIVLLSFAACGTAGEWTLEEQNDLVTVYTYDGGVELFGWPVDKERYGGDIKLHFHVQDDNIERLPLAAREYSDFWMTIHNEEDDKYEEAPEKVFWANLEKYSEGTPVILKIDRLEMYSEGTPSINVDQIIEI